MGGFQQLVDLWTWIVVLLFVVGAERWKPAERGKEPRHEEVTTCIRGYVADVFGWMCGDLQQLKKNTSTSMQTYTNTACMGGGNILDPCQWWTQATRRRVDVNCHAVACVCVSGIDWVDSSNSLTSGRELS